MSAYPTALAIAVFISAASIAPLCATAQDDDPFRLGAMTFNEHCAACHSGSPESLGFGPPLNGIIGRDAATYDVYPEYSDALKSSGLVWSEDNLRLWIQNAAEMVPETTMPVIGLSDAQIDALMVYLVFISE